MHQHDDEVKHDERRWQDQQGGQLQQDAFDRPGTRLVLVGQFERIARALELAEGLRVLDLGCGVGHFLRWVTEHARVRGVGADLSIASLAVSRAATPTLDLAAADAERLPFADETFDRIACNGAAHHFLDGSAAFQEMHRVLKHGGVLVLHEPTTSSLTSGLRRLVPRYDRYESPADIAHKEEFTARRAVAAIAAAGFTNIETSFHDFLAYPLSGNYINLPLGRSRKAMGFLWRLEQRLAGQKFLAKVWQALSWRLLVVARKA
jgi:ubiquinone/menaquinone biosynthesis C-methylase UbiE